MNYKETVLIPTAVLLSKLCSEIDSYFYSFGQDLPSKNKIQKWLRDEWDVDMSVHLNGMCGINVDGTVTKNYGGHYIYKGDVYMLGLTPFITSHEEAQETIIKLILNKLLKEYDNNNL